LIVCRDGQRYTQNLISKNTLKIIVKKTVDLIFDAGSKFYPGAVVFEMVAHFFSSYKIKSFGQ
jgi:hypothetical protein